jgi:succinate dehydrogenase/fumarate reductase flavoprotein subunit
MIIDYELLKGFDRTLTNALFQGLQVAGMEAQERAAGYLQENPNVIRRREALEHDLEKFEAALADLQNIPGINSTSGYGSDIDGDADLSD